MMTNLTPPSTSATESYLAQGGKLTSPANVTPRYRGELMRLMGRFVDSELAASAGFAQSINFAPGIKERIAACRITLEKAHHAWQVLSIMEEFGTDISRYQSAHDWASRLPRQTALADIQDDRDRRLPIFHFPLLTWIDAVVMNVLMGQAADIQLSELCQVSYAPLAEAYRAIAPIEHHHFELGLEGLARILNTPAHKTEVNQSLTYWWPRVEASFGGNNAEHFTLLQSIGLRHKTNEALLADWRDKARQLWQTHGLGVPLGNK